MFDRAVLLLHGFTNTGASWAPVVDRLGETYRSVAPDLRGHGSAACLEPVDLPSVLADLDAQAPPSFVLCGYSQGGRLALHLALAIPERVEGLVLIGASPGIADPVTRAERRRADERLADEIEALSLEEFVARWGRTPVLAGLSPDAAALAHEDRLRNESAGLARALRGLGTGALPSLWERLGELRMGVTLIAGERDVKFSEIARQMAERISGARVEIVLGAGHQVHLERPEIVAAEIRKL